jgi:hypothetical protein
MLNRFTNRTLSLKYIFQVLIFFLPTQLGYHFWPKWAYVFGIRVDYFAPTLYLTDLLVILFIALSFLSKRHSWRIASKKLFIFVSIFIIGILNIVYAKNSSLALVKLLKIVELSFLGYLISREKQFDLNSWLIKPFTLSVIVFSLIGIGQSLLEHTLGGPLYILGEREFDIRTSGIALSGFFGREFLRAYSTFSHPNSLAGFIGVSLILIYLLRRKGRLAKILWVLALMLGVIVFIFANSQGAFLSLLLVSIIYFIYRYSKTLAKQIIKLAFLVSILLSLLLPIIFDEAPRVSTRGIFSTLLGGAKSAEAEVSSHSFPRLRTGFSAKVDKFNFLTLTKPEGFVNRLILAKIAGQIFSENPVIGVGLNNFIFTAIRYSSYSRITWLLQPVHNIYLLVISEAGALGLALFLLLIYLAIMKLTYFYNKKSIAFVLTIIFIISTGLFDHYWFTLQQNQLIFSLILGIAFRKS